jgi:hypothetical protein
MSYWNGAYDGNNNSNLSRCSGGPIVAERARSIVDNFTSNGYSYVVLGNIQICWGRANITPVANTATKLWVTFPRAFSKSPAVTLAPITAVPRNNCKRCRTRRYNCFRNKFICYKN